MPGLAGQVKDKSKFKDNAQDTVLIAYIVALLNFLKTSMRNVFSPLTFSL